MKTLNFNAVKILPSLLNKTKEQTIRKGWIGKFETLKPIYGKEHSINWRKPPKFKVGDRVQLVWNEESEYEWFRKKDGSSYMMMDDEKMFHKILGQVEITEVFEIEMGVGGVGFYVLKGNAQVEYGDLGLRKNITLSKRDGFKSAKDMFNYFDKNYDLSNPKKFLVYRWKYK